MIEYPHPKLSLRRQCSLLSVNRGGLSYQPVPADEQTLQIMRRLDEWYTEHPDLGHRRLVVLLKQEVGMIINITEEDVPIVARCVGRLLEFLKSKLIIG